MVETDLGYSAYIHRIVIYYRKNRPDRLKGYHLYISNSFKENNPNSGHECFHYPMSTNNPTIIQNKTCDWTGRYIVYYNKRDDLKAFVELCEVEVFGCYVGRYGSQCKSRCPVNCNNGTCSIWDGSCASCKEGFKEIDVIKVLQNPGLKWRICDKGTYGINCSTSCTNCKNQSCDHRTGECPTEAGCKAGFHGSKCSKGCSANTYSENCQLQCHCLNGITCNDVNGQCPEGLCDPGWRSNTCSQKCEVGTYGPNCQNTCDNCKYTECNQFNGTCTHGCSAGWKGPKCEISCEKGTYGPNCQDTCDNCKDTECNQFNGTCTDGCSAGWKGSKCDMRCKNGTYGPNCQDTCDNCQETECNQFNGTCTRGCSAGWKGPKCEIRCENGTYGPNCQDTCDNCKDTECNQFNGTCTDGCSAGLKGSKCDMKCENGTYGPNCQDTRDNCKETECNEFNGTCTDGCSAGWKGPKCEITIAETSRDHRTGICPIDGGCKVGYQGLKCITACYYGTYGTNCQETCDNCKDTECNQFNGTCTHGCSAGWMGPKCAISCSAETYGENCRYECHCFDGKPCDNRNGLCPDGLCDAGWKSNSCNQTCGKGTYGINCSESCRNCINESCDHFDGRCLTEGGCKAGYQGSKCSEGMKRANRTRKPRRGTQFSNELTGNPAYSNDTFESPQYAQVDKENQMSSKGIMVELGNVSTSEDSDTNDIRPDNLYLNTESTDADNLYSNTEAKNVFSEYNIAVGNLPSVAKMKRKNNAFKKEYAMLPKGLKFPHSEGEREENSKKNRYLTTFPYDHSRVQLDTYDANTDYINANYIKNYSKDKAYIATQGPKKNTLSDFWQMIWQENVDTIIMVTNLMEGDKKKCDQYWPESTHKKVVIGEFTLKMLEERENTVYIYRCIQLTCEHTDRIVHQFHFTKWPDHDVPDKTNLVNFYRKVKSSPNAGVGRTGTFLALDALYKHGNATGFVNIMEYTHMMRQDRMNMIQTVEQYATVYDILVEAFIVPQSAIPKQDFLNMLDSRLIEREYQKLQDLKPVIDANKFQAGKLKENVPKNAVQNLLPHDDYRPYLMSYGRSSNDYINAVKIQSFREGRNIFVTQYPLQNTIGDLWSLVYDNDCRTIVILDELSEDVIPSSTSHRFSNDNFIISRISSNALQDKVTISLRHKNKKEERPITVFVYNDWEDTNMIPNSTKTMIDFTEEISRTTREDNESKIVICRDGCTRCGIYVTLDLVLEKMEIDEEIDILQVARRIQTRRPQFLSNIEQFEFCYCALKELLSSQAVYANSGNLLSVYR
ncbi:Tyrosine-protein phosphatase non-receptor type 5,Receptor-type tyrosine-protein phosphatase eta [Mytilus edulis]|uniref:Tyrosine-protein phosphatase non-receptor type 5,Receptor-type tyrosine-protein phosphatase eta n=1 Tax=Mytilus edulis TaxID=6550 RepID=A0A8S3Q1B4_MYTED|nr:Tyrosine-protein phosphatase non-receptor type 5,Receptor-type tyrosine-protein phosphatase eta [Mytilus edulis]